MDSNIIIGDTMLDEKTLNSILEQMCESFAEICEEHGVATLEDDFETLREAISDIKGFGR